MDGWVQIGTAFGVPMLILAGLAWFVATRVWPVVVKQIEFNQQQQREFLTALKDIHNSLASQNDAIRGNTEAIRGLTRLTETLRRSGSSGGKPTDR